MMIGALSAERVLLKASQTRAMLSPGPHRGRGEIGANSWRTCRQVTERPEAQADNTATVSLPI